MADPSRAVYRTPDNWPHFGECVSHESLRTLALQWIELNLDFVVTRFRDEGIGREVASLLAVRALEGGGLVIPLVRHAEGARSIDNPEVEFRTYVKWAAKELRRPPKAAPAEDQDLEQAASKGWWTLGTDCGDDGGHLWQIDKRHQQLIEKISDMVRKPFDDVERGKLEPVQAVHYTMEWMSVLYLLFCKFAPPALAAMLTEWDSDNQACALLGIYPMELPHSMVAMYRRLAFPETKWNATPGGTQKQISRLRARLKNVCPPEAMPRSTRSDDPRSLAGGRAEGRKEKKQGNAGEEKSP